MGTRNRALLLAVLLLPLLLTGCGTSGSISFNDNTIWWEDVGDTLASTLFFVAYLGIHILDALY